ncbi:MAG: alpha-1,2-fucosyltransferase [Gemmatimonadetes bacterium]|nr:alpha-1,2-fucosyltransferase [Gemmatimonadota bacterium]
MKRKVIVRLRGGLGNQLFGYAAGRSLAIRNDAELVLDTISDFAVDHTYQRTFALGAFNIAGRPATSGERLEPLGYWRRRAARWVARRSMFEHRRYVVEDHRGWNPSFLELPADGTITLDGYWQSERYFQAIEGILRSELRPSTGHGFQRELLPSPHEGNRAPEPSNASTQPLIAVHFRWFGDHLPDSLENIPVSYYEQAVALCETKFSSPLYALFSDDIELAKARLPFLPKARTIVASTPASDPTGVRELLLMSACHHFVIANSTFSWWGAWLGCAQDKVVIAPHPRRLHSGSFWRAPELLPPKWILL